VRSHQPSHRSSAASSRSGSAGAPISPRWRFHGTLAWSRRRLLPETNPAPDPTATHPFRIIGNFGTFLGNRLYLGYLLGVALSYAGIFCFISGSSFVLVDLVGVSPDLYGFCFGAIVIGYIAGSMTGGRLVGAFRPIAW
jgi:hypothetical protein